MSIINWFKSLFSTEEGEDDITYKHCNLCNFIGTTEEIKQHLQNYHKLT